MWTDSLFYLSPLQSKSYADNLAHPYVDPAIYSQTSLKESRLVAYTERTRTQSPISCGPVSDPGLGDRCVLLQSANL